MKNKNYIIKYSGKKFNLQIISMNKSYFIYMGDNQMNFENLLISIPTYNDKEKDSTEDISSRFLIDDESNDLSEVINNYLVSKLKIPIFFSCNIYDLLLLKDPLFISFLQENLLKILMN